ncbi:lysophospholipid acyltransferase family protein [Streptomyces sp. AM8-1-1]|uniref:lysophospholipid acyltransferase family protein n=1 Tax=Streptomyces sp. AM8-1-1 TaxID=3075825 RepID=UPI0028C3B4E3|nr:lysophospholipid acyltransferase family protein [Streptomyces sp. AM8-1-1]WNO70962.1 lysophospholipid acyltransferase family protein [Streptomyces sp. AM8-1-1]
MSVWLPGAPCTPAGCATHQGPVAGTITAVARLTAGLLTALAGILVGPLVALLALVLGTRFRHLATRCWTRAVLRAFGVRLRIVGRPYAPRGSLVVANHISWLDIPLMATALPGRMLAKTEVRHWPVLGPLAARGGTFFLERDRLRTLPAAVAEMASALRGGARVIAFPEGSTWCGREQGRFRHAVFQAALDAGASVQPVRITYLPTGAAAFVGEDSLPASLWRVVAAGELTAEIRLLPAIPAGSFPDRRSLARAAQQAVARDSANLPSLSVHQFVNSMPAAASSVRTPS